MKATHPVLFHEVQRFRDVWWVMVLVFGVAAVQWWIFLTPILTGAPVGNNPAPTAVALIIWLLFGVGLPAFFLALRLEVDVYPDAVAIRYAPLFERTIARYEIAVVELRRYGPMREFGGWGIRGFGGRIAYNVRGNEGVELTLTDGRQVLIGSGRAEELAGAISSIV